MSGRELIALGTSSQVPTRERSQNAYVLRWDGIGILFDPGEGAQRQLTLAGVSAASIHAICITHFHGDHCLGLAGVFQRLALEGGARPVHLFFPEDGREYLERLRNAAIYHPKAEWILHPVPWSAGRMLELSRTDAYVLKCHALDHAVSTIGYRIEEPEGRRLVPEKLETAGVHGRRVGELQRAGRIRSAGRMVRIEDVSVPRARNVFAFVMDTRPCPGSVALAMDADLLVMEATYAAEHKNLADLYFHSTAADAAGTARDAGARRLAITHFSQRYRDAQQHLRDARAIFPDVVALNDLDRLPIARRRDPDGTF
jgi:ribonuclease Z